MSQLYSSDDPWENGWATGTDESKNTQGFLGFNSTYLTSSQLLNSNTHQSSSDSVKKEVTNVPSSYREVYSKNGQKVPTAHELETVVFDRLVTGEYLTSYQKSRILDIIYDHNLLPPSDETNFYQILGLIALELSVPGTGDYVTLQFKLANLPELPKQAVDDLCSTRTIVDPLGVLLENATLEDDKPQSNWSKPDPLLTDHSDTFLQQQPDVKHSPQKKIHNQVPIDSNSINKYIDDIREKFKPLLQSVDSIKIKEIPEKEGLLFKHVNYIITHDLKLGMNSTAGTKKVIRRYSDFVWYVYLIFDLFPVPY